MFINFVFFFRPYGLIRGPTFIRFWIFFHGLQIFSSFLCLFKALRSLVLPNYPSPTFIQGPTFILFVKISRPYVYSLPYVYSRQLEYDNDCLLTFVLNLYENIEYRASQECMQLQKCTHSNAHALHSVHMKYENVLLKSPFKAV